ncbi:MAG: DUF669 domain-containing protein [Hyphomicrobiales bacterium]
MANLGNFDAGQVEPTSTYEVVPPGKYLAQIVASEMRVTKDGQGQYLWLELDILDGTCAGRKLFDRLTSSIATRRLSRLPSARFPPFAMPAAGCRSKTAPNCISSQSSSMYG